MNFLTCQTLQLEQCGIITIEILQGYMPYKKPFLKIPEQFNTYGRHCKMLHVCKITIQYKEWAFLFASNRIHKLKFLDNVQIFARCMLHNFFWFMLCNHSLQYFLIRYDAWLRPSGIKVIRQQKPECGQSSLVTAQHCKSYLKHKVHEQSSFLQCIGSRDV